MNNIYSKKSYLRRRLGYLEPNFIELYKYAMPSAKSFFRIAIELFVIYVVLILCSITEKISNKIFYEICLAIFIVIFIIIIIEVVWCFMRFLYYKIRK